MLACGRACLQVGTAAFIVGASARGRACLQVGTAAFIMDSGGSAYMSPGGDCRVCYCRRARYAFLRVSTITSIFRGLSDAFVQTSIKHLLLLACTSPGGDILGALHTCFLR